MRFMVIQVARKMGLLYSAVCHHMWYRKNHMRFMVIQVARKRGLLLYLAAQVWVAIWMFLLILCAFNRLSL